MYKRVQKTLFAIRSVLLNSEIVRKLLYNDSNAALSLPAPTLKETKDYITLQPIYEFGNDTNKKYEQNGMINIVLEDSEPNEEENSLVGVIRINIVFNVDKWELLDEKIRPIELSDVVIELLDNKKFSISNPLSFSGMQPLILTKQLTGYALLFNLIDGSSNLENY